MHEVINHEIVSDRKSNSSRKCLRHLLIAKLSRKQRGGLLSCPSPPIGVERYLLGAATAVQLLNVLQFCHVNTCKILIDLL